MANTGPQTQPDSPTSVSVIDTATKKVTATIPTKGAPSQVAFSPDGATAYVVTADGLCDVQHQDPQPYRLHPRPR